MSNFRLARISLLLAAIGLSAVPAVHAQDKPADAKAEAPKDAVRPELHKLLDPKVVQPLMTAKNYAEIKKLIDQADAFPNKNPYETYVIDRMKLAHASSTGNDAEAIAALERVTASGRLDKKEQETFLQALGNYYFNGKDYPKAIATYQRFGTETGKPEVVRTALIRAHYLSGDYATTVKMMGEDLDAMAKAGKVPSEEDLRLYASSANKVKDNASYVKGLELLVTHYPSDELWADLLGRLQSRQSYDLRLQADLYRLLNSVSATMGSDEYVELAELDLAAGIPTEAKTVVDAGFKAGILGTGPQAANHKKLRDRANKGAADDAKNIASGEAGAHKNKDGIGLVNLGYAYVTMGQFDKGIDLIQKGIAKGTRRQEDAKLRLGIAYLKAGRKDEAIKAFESVKGDQNLNDLARYWILHAKRPAGAAAPAAGAE
ncbi:tetratricopeptide repeat protein [Pseudoduganella sp. GCM10020061]|uniref:tetratricopeptide repeat protein n=1 Tax=Pseudoduganella sp. GCM10020061 TaxID=3317345 RepID=UPI0036276795